MYEKTDEKFAKSYFHWFFLIQPAPLPERMIMTDPRKWIKNCLDKWSGNHKFGSVEEAYLNHLNKKKDYMLLVKTIELQPQLIWSMIKKIEIKNLIFQFRYCGEKKE